MSLPAQIKHLVLETGPATLIPLSQVELLKDAPRKENELKVLTDRHGVRVHMANDFSGFHIYMICTSPKKKILIESLDYYDKVNGFFSLSVEVTQNDGTTKNINLSKCKVPLLEAYPWGLTPPTDITVHQYATGIPDSLGFKMSKSTECFRFSNNLVPFIKNELSEEDRHFFDLKVEYIGLSVGDEGSREVHERLGQGHKKETQVMHDINNRKPHLDCFAVLFKPGQLTEGENGPVSDSLTFSETVAVLEKSLISQFKTSNYNKIDINFPYNGGEYVSKLKRMGTQQIRITAKSPSEFGRIYSSEVEPEKTHYFQIEL
jgi:hypothetical protein